MAIVCYIAVVSYSFSQDSEYQSILFKDELKKDADAIVRQDSMHIEISSYKDMEITKEYVITVFNKAGNRYVRIGEGYDKERSIKSIEAVVYDRIGNVVKRIKKRDFKDRSAVSNGTLYSDSRVLYYDYTPTFYPYTIKFVSTVKTANTVFIPNWYFISGYNLSVEKSDLHIVYNESDMELLLKEDNLEAYDIEKEITTNSIIYKARSLPAIKSEELAPEFPKIAPKLQITSNHFNIDGVEGYAGNWSELGKWMYDKILINRDQLPESTVAKAKALVKDIDDPYLKAKKIYEFVQEQTRYISVQVGIGGIQPITAEEVDRVKYGDCKGLTNYTRSLLAEVGIESYYTHVEAGSEIVDFETEFASLEQGNHAILAIPYNDNYCWIDCTSRLLPFNFIGDFTDNRNVLVMKPEGGEIVKTASYLNEDNLMVNQGMFQLNEDGSIDAEVDILTKGVLYDNHFYLETRSQEDIDKFYKQYWNYINNMSIASFEFENDKDSISFSENVKFSAEKYASISGDRIIFNINAFDRNSYVPDRYRNRTTPFEIQRGYMYKDSITIKLPKGYTIEAMSEGEKIENEFGTYEYEISKMNDNELLYRKQFLLRKGSYSKGDYDSYRTFRRKTAKLENQKIVLIKQQS
ncbi:DUF3857 domain-containing protein [Galbibacter sp. EGI 63066]|uniref:DUF3857 domain-containing protein n=1 Tax=Galbibacter sp. EGI 63066 TaxID=2993559 RepID=UPI002248C50E|nr:DUF3857 domain-containing protein [Galbibacter sp. EGI 63066]MCX2680420.1 DUF3857 domain-containing protein [Galbibacter sp. EGI 63066]